MKGTGTTVGAAPPFERERSALVQPRPRSMIWIYDLPQWLLCASVVAIYAVTSLIGSQLLRSWVRETAADQPEHNDIVGNFLSAGGVLYGLLLGLVAVGAWQNHSDAEAIVTREATRIAALYRDLAVYPDPPVTSWWGSSTNTCAS